MCEDSNLKDCGCIYNILKKILMLQKEDYDNECFTGCDKPYLGPTSSCVCYNTRPIMLYNCCTGNPWEFPYTLGETTDTSSVFRVENADNCCCTCRVLAFNDTTRKYEGTTDFFTIDLKCVGAIKCLTDTYIDLC